MWESGSKVCNFVLLKCTVLTKLYYKIVSCPYLLIGTLFYSLPPYESGIAVFSCTLYNLQFCVLGYYY